MQYLRRIYPELLLHAQSKTNTVLTGMRRVGKTTIVKALLNDLANKNSLFLDLERLDNRELFNQDNYEAILESLVRRGLTREKPMVVALDEAQYVKNIPSIIKYLSDHYQIKFIVTGSSSYYLKNLFSESLSGRKKIFELKPLDFGEYLLFKGIIARPSDWMSEPPKKDEFAELSYYYEDYVRYGGFPQVVLSDNEESKRDFLSDIMSSYINIDVKTLADFADERNLVGLIKLLASRVGSRIDVSKLSRHLGISRQTVSNYLEFLEKTYLIATVAVMSKNQDREIVKAKKLYFGDTGLLNYWAEVSSGSQFENTIYNQLKNVGEVRYFAQKNGLEIDFVLNSEIAFEVKEHATSSDFTQLSNLASKIDIEKKKLVGRYWSNDLDNWIWGGSIR